MECQYCSTFRPSVISAYLLSNKESEMRFTLLGLVVLAVSFNLTGCGSKNQQSDSGSDTGDVAVIDLDKVAKELGRDAQMVNSLQQRQETLNQKLLAVQTSFRNQIAEQKRKVGDEPIREEAQHLLRMQQQANIQLNQERQKAQTNLGYHKAQLITSFRDDVRPVALQVAAEKGLDLIVTKNDNVIFAHHQEIDITDEVVSRLSAVSPAKAARSSSVNGDDNRAAKQPTGLPQRR